MMWTSTIPVELIYILIVATRMTVIVIQIQMSQTPLFTSWHFTFPSHRCKIILNSFNSFSSHVARIYCIHGQLVFLVDMFSQKVMWHLVYAMTARSIELVCTKKFALWVEIFSFAYDLSRHMHEGYGKWYCSHICHFVRKMHNVVFHCLLCSNWRFFKRTH